MRIGGKPSAHTWLWPIPERETVTMCPVPASSSGSVGRLRASAPLSVVGADGAETNERVELCH